MSSLKLSLRNLFSQPLSFILTLLLIVVTLVSLNVVWNVNEGLQQQLTNNTKNVDMVVGAKGSPIQIILSTLLFIDNPTGNINKSVWEEYSKNPLVESAIPISVGDNYKGYKIVGSKSQVLDFFKVEIAEGKSQWKSNELIIGAQVAERLQLKVGDEIHASHGNNSEGKSHDHHHLVVKAILEPNNSVIDQLILTDLSSVWNAHDYIEGADQEITALWLSFKSPLGIVQFPRIINKRENLMVALPVIEMNRLTKITGSGIELLQYFAYLLLFISFFSFFIHMMNQIQKRKQDLALMRLYGIRRSKAIEMVLLESISIAVIGFALAWGISKLAFYAINDITAAQYKIPLTNAPVLSVLEIKLLLGTILIAVLSSVIPLYKAMKVDVLKVLKTKKFFSKVSDHCMLKTFIAKQNE